MWEPIHNDKTNVRQAPFTVLFEEDEDRVYVDFESPHGLKGANAGTFVIIRTGDGVVVDLFPAAVADEPVATNWMTWDESGDLREFLKPSPDALIYESFTLDECHDNTLKVLVSGMDGDKIGISIQITEEKAAAYLLRGDDTDLVVEATWGDIFAAVTQ